MTNHVIVALVAGVVMSMGGVVFYAGYRVGTGTAVDRRLTVLLERWLDPGAVTGALPSDVVEQPAFEPPTAPAVPAVQPSPGPRHARPEPTPGGTAQAHTGRERARQAIADHDARANGEQSVRPNVWNHPPRWAGEDTQLADDGRIAADSPFERAQWPGPVGGES